MIVLLGILDGSFSFDVFTVLMLVFGPVIGGATFAFMDWDGSAGSRWFLVLEVAMVIGMALMSLVAVVLLLAIVVPVAVTYALGLVGYRVTNNVLRHIDW